MRRRYQTGDHALVRRINLSIVMDCLRERAPLSRAQLAEITGLNKTTVSSLVGQLIEQGFLRERGFGVPGAGRPGVLLELNPNAGRMIGLEFGVDFILLLMTDFTAQPIWRYEERGDFVGRPEDGIARAVQIIREAVARDDGRGHPVLGLGAGVPGLVNVDAGELVNAANLEWYHVPLRDWLRERFNVPVHIDNDANAAALGEKYFGAARDADNFVYLNAGVGLGGAVYIDRRLFRGRRGYAGEIGHMFVVDNGIRCSCGNFGCWETVVSQSGVLRFVQAEIARGRPTALQPSRLDFDQVLSAAEVGDAVALDAFNETARYLGLGVASLINVFDPDMVVLGGVLSRAAHLLLPVAERTIEAHTFPQPYNRTQFRISTHGYDACVMGGVALVLNDILNRTSVAADPAVKDSLGHRVYASAAGVG